MREHVAKPMVEQRPADLAGLKQLLAGGDVLSPVHVRKFLAQARGVKLINGYGPTENTTFTCCHTLTGASELVFDAFLTPRGLGGWPAREQKTA